MLSNGNILLIGGESSTSATSYSSAVYLSKIREYPSVLGTAKRFSLTNFISCVMPSTNTVLVIGGYSSVSPSALMYMNNDGAGVKLVQQTFSRSPLYKGLCILI